MIAREELGDVPADEKKRLKWQSLAWPCTQIILAKNGFELFPACV